eukprot:m.11200 g.11200  ORF g.11200 m.11200 type:complete len:158 (-) comp2828_c0_seq2:1036-1509(-)
MTRSTSMARAVVGVGMALVGMTTATVPSVKLSNAADDGIMMPAVGLGTGGYGNTGPDKYQYPECWSDGQPGPDGHSAFDCSDIVVKATMEWLKMGGRRIDNADSYYNMRAIGKAMAESNVPREDIFLVGKIGSGNVVFSFFFCCFFLFFSFALSLGG